MKQRPGVWSAAATTVAVVFFVLAVRPDVYEATSPHWLSWHVLLRKTYSIGAFGIVGYLLRRALEECGIVPSTTLCAAAVALYSAAIEGAQFAGGVREGFAWNAVDVACGAIGGALGGIMPWPTRARPRH